MLRAEAALDVTRRVVCQRAHARSGGAIFRVGVGVMRQHLFLNKSFDPLQRTPGGNVVGVNDAPLTERCLCYRILSN